MRAGGLERPKALADQLLMPPTWFSPASGAALAPVGPVLLGEPTWGKRASVPDPRTLEQ